MAESEPEGREAGGDGRSAPGTLCVRGKFYGQATKGVRVDALAQAGDEGRGKLR